LWKYKWYLEGVWAKRLSCEGKRRTHRMLEATTGGCLQAQDLRSSAEDSDLWEPHCLSRWPGATAQLYSGSWCRVYQARARMPATFPLAADKIHALTAAAKDEAQQQRGQRAVPQQRDAVLQLAFDELMSSLSALGMAVTR